MECKCGACGGSMKGLAHIGIMVADMEKSLAFYRDALGFEVTNEADMGEVKLAFLNVGTCLLELVQTPSAQKREAGPVDHVAIEVEGIEELVCRLTDRGVAFLTEEVGSAPNLLGGIKNIFFTGPDGERLEFFEYCKG